MSIVLIEGETLNRTYVLLFGFSLAHRERVGVREDSARHEAEKWL
jgi:hypothetical protein